MIKSNDKSRTITLGLILLAIASLLLVYGTGILRDKVFVSMNRILGTSGPRHPVQLFSSQWILLAKWALTLFFSLLYYSFCLLMIRLVRPEKTLYKLCTYLYAGLFTTSLLISLVGLLIGQTESAYRIARDIAGLVQSPIIIMLVFAALQLYSRMPQEKK